MRLIRACACSPAPDRSHPGETDGTEPTAATPASTRAPRRVSRPLLARSRNKSGRTGKPTATRAKPSSCSREAAQSGGVASLKYPPDFPLQFRERRVPHRSSWIEHHVPLRIQQTDMAPDCLSHSPLDPVAHHRLTHRPRHRQPDPWPSPRLARTAKCAEVPARHSHSFPVGPAEVARPQQPVAAGEGKIRFSVDRINSCAERLVRR